MKYLMIKSTNILFRVDTELEELKLKTTFMNSKFKEIEVFSIPELFEKGLSFVNFRKIEDSTLLSTFYVIDNDGDIVLLYFGTTTECNAFKSLVGCGIVERLVELKNSTVDKQLITVRAIKNRINSTNFIADCILSRNINTDESISVTPEKYLHITEKEVKKENVKIDMDSTYLTDPIYKILFDCVDKLGDCYKEIISQKEGLRNTVRNCDLATMNILHNLEFEFDKVSASGGYLKAKKIHGIRECRRRAKDKLEVISVIEQLLGNETFEEMKGLPKRLKNRKYQERNNVGMYDLEKYLEVVDSE